MTQSWWRAAPVSTPAEAQADLDRWCVAVSDRRRRGASTVGELAAAGAAARSAGAGVPGRAPGRACRRRRRAGRVRGQPLQRPAQLRRRRPSPSAPGSARCIWRSTRQAGRRIARHRRAPNGAGQIAARTRARQAARTGRPRRVHHRARRARASRTGRPANARSPRPPACAARTPAAWSSISISTRGSRRSRQR